MNPGQNATGKDATDQTRTKCHRIRMHQNCNNKSYNSVTKLHLQNILPTKKPGTVMTREV